MSKTVFILGAGASRDSGAPLMNNFIDEARFLYENDKIDEIFKEDFARALAAIDNLYKIYQKSNLDLENVESVYSLFEMGKFMKKLPGVSNWEDIEKIIDSLKILILYTLDKNITIRVSNGRLYPDGSYMDFVSMIESIKDKDGSFPSIISFKYDLALDCALHYYQIDVDYCLGNNNNNYLKLLKLHGSLNWFKSKESNEIIPYGFNKINEWYFGMHALDEEDEKVEINLPKKFSKEKIIFKEQELLPIPIIIPPTWNKLEFSYNFEIAKVWQKAAEELSNAENIFVVGYSYPETDNFFKYFLALGILGEKLIKKFWIFNPDQSIEDRFKSLLGPRINKKYKFEKIPFSEAIKYLDDNSDVPSVR